MKRRVGAAPEIGDGTHYDPDMLKGLLQLADLEALSGVEAPNGINDLMGTSQEPKNFTDIAPIPSFQNIETVPPQQKLGVEPSALPRNEQGELIPPLQFIQSRVKENPELMNLLPQETQNMIPREEDKSLYRHAGLQAPPEPEEKGVMGKLGDVFNRFKDYVENKEAPNQELPGREDKSLYRNAGLQAAPEAGIPKMEQPKIIPPEQEITQQDVEQHPEQAPQANSVEKGEADPQIMEDLKRLNGNKILPPEYIDGAKRWQRVFTEKQETLNEEETSLLNKAETGNLTTLDKVMIGIAVAIPILFGLRYGFGAGLSSAGEGLKGYADVQLKQQKTKQEAQEADRKKLEGIQDRRLELEEKNIKINKELLDSIPNPEAREFIKNKKIKQIGDKIGISTGDENNALWFDGNQLDDSADSIKEARKNLSEAKETVGLLNKSNRVIDEVIDVLDAMPDDTGLWEAIKSNYGWFTGAAGHNPLGMEPLMIDVKDKDGKVRKVNAFEILKQKMTALQDVYNKVNLGKTALTSNVLAHWSGILGDPKNLHEWFTGQSLQTVKDKTQSLKDFLNEGAVEGIIGLGFLRDPLEKAYPGNRTQPLKSQDSVINQIRANPQAYSNKVK